MVKHRLYGRTHRRTCEVLAALVACLALLGTSPAPAADDGSVHFGTSTGGGVRMLTDVMQALKIDKKHGLKFKWSYFPGPRGMTALMNGGVEVANLGAIPAARMALEGRHLLNFEILFDSHISYLVPPESKVKNLWDLKGKRLGFIPRSSASYSTFAILAGQRGINPETYFKLIIGNPVALKTFLFRRDVDATMHFEPFSTAMILNGEAKEIANHEALWRANTNQPLLFVTMGSTKAWLDANPRTARNIARAVAETRRALREHPDNMKYGLKSLGPIGNNPKVVKALKERMIKKIYKTDWDDKAIASGRWQIEQAVKLGQLKQMPKQKLFLKLN